MSPKPFGTKQPPSAGATFTEREPLEPDKQHGVHGEAGVALEPPGNPMDIVIEGARGLCRPFPEIPEIPRPGFVETPRSLDMASHTGCAAATSRSPVRGQEGHPGVRYCGHRASPFGDLFMDWMCVYGPSA